MRGVLALALIAGCNCKSKPDDPGVASGSAPPPVIRETPRREVKPPVIVVPKQEAFIVRDAGKGAKAVMRYTLPDGTIEQHVETRLSSRAFEGGKLGKPTELPVIRDGFAVTFAKGTKPLLRPLVAELATATPLGEQYTAPWRTLVQNRRVDVEFDDRGEFHAISFKDDPQNLHSQPSKDELVQRLLATTVPLPEPAIGVGARWEVYTVLRQGPLYIKQTGTYTLSARSKDRWKLHVKLLRVGEEQTVLDPSLPANAVANLEGLFRTLEGDVEVDPKQPFIAAGKLAVESRVHVRIRIGKQPPTEQMTEDRGTVTLAAKW